MKNKPYSMRCLDSISALVGGRDVLAELLGVKKITIAHWLYRGRVSSRHILGVVKAGQGKFTADELLGKFDGVEDCSEVASE